MTREATAHERLADRLANILTKLNMGCQLSVKELAEEFSVNPRTITRDFDRLSRFLNLIEDPQSRKFYLEPSHLGKIMPKDIQNFAKLSGISHLYPSLDISFLKELLDSRANQIYSAKGYAFEDAAQFTDIFKVLGNAIQNSLQVGFLYKNEPRLVQPYRLIHHHGSWYLAAVRKDELRSYRLSHISLNPSSHTYSAFQPNAEILKLLEDEEGIWFGQEKKEVILSIHADVASYFKQRRLLPEQQLVKELDDGGLLVSSRISHDIQLLPLVRFWIPNVKVVNPEGMQAELENELKRYLGS